MPSLALTKLAEEQGCLDGVGAAACSIARPNIRTPDIGKVQDLSCLAPLYQRISNKAVLRYDLRSAGLWTRLRYVECAARTAAKGVRPKSSHR